MFIKQITIEGVDHVIASSKTREMARLLIDRSLEGHEGER